MSEGDGMDVLRHWIVRDGAHIVYLVTDNEAIASDYRDNTTGFSVDGPFVPEATLRGAVAALAEAMEGWAIAAAQGNNSGQRERWERCKATLDHLRGQ